MTEMWRLRLRSGKIVAPRRRTWPLAAIESEPNCRCGRKHHSPKKTVKIQKLSLVCYKLFEYIIRQRISRIMDDLLNVNQDGYRCDHSISDQVGALTAFTVNGFEKLKTSGAIFWDLTAANDIICKYDHITDIICHDLHWLHSVQARHDGVQVPSSHGAVVPSRHVHSCVIYNWSSTSPFCRPSQSDNSTQSIGAIWITQLRHFRPFNLELVATDCSRHEPYIH